MIKNILIVEDDVQQSTNLKKILKELDKGLNIYEAQSEDEALDICNKESIDLFYVDVSLKDSSGIDFSKALRKIEKYELSWIIFLTTHVNYIMEAFKQIHCYDYIIKPYEKKHIIELTEKLILGKQRNAAVEAERKSAIFDLKNGISIRMYIDEILFIEKNIKTCCLHTKKGKYEVKGLVLKKFLESIECDDIVQSYKSCLVNTKNIKEIRNIDSKVSEIYFEDYPEKSPLGYKFKNSVFEKFR